MNHNTYTHLLNACASQHEREFRASSIIPFRKLYHKTRLRHYVRALADAEAGHFPQRVPSGENVWLVPSLLRGGIVFQPHPDDPLLMCNCSTSILGFGCWHIEAVEIACIVELLEREQVSAELATQLPDIAEVTYADFLRFMSAVRIGVKEYEHQH